MGAPAPGGLVPQPGAPPTVAPPGQPLPGGWAAPQLSPEEAHRQALLALMGPEAPLPPQFTMPKPFNPPSDAGNSPGRRPEP